MKVLNLLCLNALTRGALGLGLAALACAAQAAPVDVVTEVEPNNKRAQAQTVPTSAGLTLVTGAMAQRTDVDLYRVDLGLGECIVVAMTPNPLADLDLEMLNSFGLVLAASKERGLAQIETLATCGLPLSQTYYFRVLRYSGRTGALAGSYAMEIAPAPVQTF